MTGRSKRKTALLNSGTLSPNPWDLSLSGQNGWPYTEGTRTEDKAPQGCDLSAASSAGMAAGGVDPDAAPNQHPDPSNINLLRAQNGLDNGVHRTYRSPLLLALYGVLLRHKHPLHPTVQFGPILTAEFDHPAALQKLLNLCLRQIFCVLHAYLHPAAERLSTSHFHDHLVLESMTVSGSSCIGQFSRGQLLP